MTVQKNLNRWFKEKWVDVSRKDPKTGKHPPCGRSKAKKSSKGYPKCRPSVKVSSKTPKTSGQMTEGQKRAATKRKRSKKQGVGGKPTVVKSGVPFDDAWLLLKKEKDPRLARAGVEGYNKPKRTPNHPKKSHIVVARSGGQVKTIRFGEQGASVAGKPKAGESDRMKAKRKSFKSRHRKNIARGPMSAAYWADKVKW